MTAPHQHPFPRTFLRTRRPGRGKRSLLARPAVAVLTTLTALTAVAVPTAALAGEQTTADRRPAVEQYLTEEQAVAGQQPDIVEQPRPGATFGEPVPPGADPTATAGVDPVTGFAINARTGFLVHPGTGHLIEPDTGYLLFADTLIYTNLRYDAATDAVVAVDGESPGPTVEPDAPTPTSTPSSSSPAPSSSAVPSPTAGGTPSGAPSSSVVPTAAVPAATPSTTTRTTRSASPSDAVTVTAAAEEERTSSLAPAALIGAGILALAALVIAVVLVRRRGSHQS